MPFCLWSEKRSIHHCSDHGSRCNHRVFKLITLILGIEGIMLWLELDIDSHGVSL